ncbi:DMT family transporter [Nisaea acidiphila]|uniref:DMT family transporter n=1 Tax=Nisaea acidiphila TaxID=1862145 RepID=A0A9J7APG3_9PROT|nr:DMT family transporter [Nisaea acidiphila]UUX48228.1 DMT family transporter [Nisaea acidiphila]
MALAETSLSARWAALSPNTQGALWIAVSCVIFSIMQANVKLLGARLDTFQIAFFRCAFGLAVILPFMFRAGPQVFKTRRPFAHLLRGCLGAGAMACGFYSVTHMPLADATAISFAKPLFMIVLAVLFLNEKVRWRRWSATAVGFLGVLIMVRPGSSEIGFASGIALLGTMFVALVVVVVKKLSETESPLTILFSFGIISTSIMTIPALLVWQQPTWTELGLLLSVGALGSAGQACAVRGFKVGEATAVVPFDYSRLIFAGFIGYWLFADIPGPHTMAGAALIVASTLYIARREAQLGKKPVRNKTDHHPVVLTDEQSGRH